MRPASDAERARLNDTFAALCRIASPFGHERECSERVQAELRGMRIEAEEDAAGNLLARLPGRGERSILLCAHLDTVDDGGVPIDPVIVDGGWENANDGILGADNKAAVAVILELARRCSVEGSPVGLELLFTTGEENALEGAKEFDASQLQSDFGYVFDHATPIGEVVTASPTYFRLAAEFHGRAAHAGIRPEAGRSAILAAAQAIAHMPLGRIDEQTTANVGSIQGGAGSTNIVPERCSLLAETRSLDPSRVEDVVVGHRRRHPRRRRPRGVRRRRRLRAPLRRLPPEAERARDRRRRGGAARLRLRAEADRHRRGVGRERARGRRLHVREPRQRHRAQPRADRARRGRRARGHARRGLRAARRGGGGMSSEFEPVGAETKYEGKIFTVREETFRHEDGEESTREIVRHTGAVGVVCHDGESLWLVRQPREAVGTPDLLEIPAGKLDVEGEEPLEAAKRELAEEIGKAAAEWEHLHTFFTSPGFTDEVCHVYLATGLSDASAETDEHERIDIEVRPLAELDAIIDEVERLEDADRAARAPPPTLNGALHRQAEPRAAANTSPWPSQTASSRMSTSCSTSSPTSSSSAGCPATRSRRTAPTCSSSATGSSARAMTRCTSTTPR